MAQMNIYKLLSGAKADDKNEEIQKPKKSETPDSETANTWEVEVKGESSKRGPGRSAFLRTGQRGRPRKIYNLRKDVVKNLEKELEDAKADRNEGQQQEREIKAKNTENSEDKGAYEDAEFAMICTEIPFKEAINGPDNNEWRKAIYDETRSMIENNVWEIVSRPGDKKVIGFRTVLRNKIGSDGAIKRRKAKIVARGFTQVQGVDFDESFFPVARLSSLRILVAISETSAQRLHSST